MTDDDPEPVVRALLTAAGLAVPEAELDGLVRVYPALRAEADALYRADLEPESPVIRFDPNEPYRGDA